MASPKGQSEKAAERAHRALDLRIAGATYRQIGKELGVSYQSAFTDVQGALAELDVLTKDRAERLRDLELGRCDKLTLALTPKARGGDEKAARVLLGVMARRAALLGLDAPAKVDATSGGNPVAFTINIAKPHADV